MKRIIFPLIFLLLVSFTFAVEQSNSKYVIYHTYASNSKVNANTSNYNVSYISGQFATNNLSSSSYSLGLGIQFMHNTTYSDVTAPTITVTSPTATTYSTSNISINFSATDSQGVDDLWFYNGTANTTYTSATYLILSDASYTFIFYANDTSNNIASESVAFTVDTSTGGSSGSSGTGSGTGGGNATNVTEQNVSKQSLIDKFNNQTQSTLLKQDNILAKAVLGTVNNIFKGNYVLAIIITSLLLVGGTGYYVNKKRDKFVPVAKKKEKTYKHIPSKRNRKAFRNEIKRKYRQPDQKRVKSYSGLPTGVMNQFRK